MYSETGRVTVTPRRPDFDFDGLEHEVPRVWHRAGIGPTAFLEALSALAPVVESFFIEDARRLQPRVAEDALRAEGDAFLDQEAAHAATHATFNRLLVRWGVPVEPIADSALRWLAIVDWTSSDLRSAVAMAGEHFLGEIGNAILSRPELLDGVAPPIARLFRWHGYEEVEHKAVLFDVFHAVRGHGLYTYSVRIAGLWIATVLLALALPSVCYRILASAGADTFARRPEPEFSADPLAFPAWEVRKPVIAAVNGHAVGIGLTLAMQCDIRLVASEAKLAFAHVRRGVLPDAHSHWTVPRAIGFARTAELSLTGRHITGEEAATIGLASRALPAADVLGAAREVARDIAVHCAPLSVALSKRLLWESRAMTREEVGQRETAYHHLVMGRPDALEGVMAFLERRPARWTLAVPRDWPETT